MGFSLEKTLKASEGEYLLEKVRKEWQSYLATNLQALIPAIKRVFES